MLNINRILQKDKLLIATRLNQKTFEELLLKFELVCLSSMKEKEKEKEEQCVKLN